MDSTAGNKIASVASPVSEGLATTFGGPSAARVIDQRRAAQEEAAAEQAALDQKMRLGELLSEQFNTEVPVASEATTTRKAGKDPLELQRLGSLARTAFSQGDIQSGIELMKEYANLKQEERLGSIREVSGGSSLMTSEGDVLGTAPRGYTHGEGGIYSQDTGEYNQTPSTAAGIVRDDATAAADIRATDALAQQRLSDIRVDDSTIRANDALANERRAAAAHNMARAQETIRAFDAGEQIPEEDLAAQIANLQKIRANVTPLGDDEKSIEAALQRQRQLDNAIQELVNRLEGQRSATGQPTAKPRPDADSTREGVTSGGPGLVPSHENSVGKVFDYVNGRLVPAQ